jgi:hypothetical protein
MRTQGIPEESKRGVNCFFVVATLVTLCDWTWTRAYAAATNINVTCKR